MPEHYRTLTVFLASPGDLRAERKAAKEAIDGLNGILGRQLNWHVELRGWEDTLPGFGRPQEIINKDVDACDLFVGLLWAKWGSATGEYSSGFEEEFERARNRRTETKVPEMWLLFKRIDEVQLSDPGDQLKQVLTFRQKQIASRELFFKEFIDVEDWKKQFSDNLLEYILSLTKPQPEISGTSPESTPATGRAESMSSEISGSGGDGTSTLATQQILKVVSQVNGAIKVGESDSLAKASEALDEFAIHRLNLFAATLSATIYTNDFLGVHEINTLYRYREVLKVANWEDYLLFKTIVKDYKSAVCPGWYWFQNMTEDSLGAWLFHIALENKNEALRERALEILEATTIRPISSKKREEIRSALLRDPSENIRKAVLRYLKAVGDDEDIPAISFALGDKDSGVREEAVRARVMVTARTNQNEAFSILLGSGEGISKQLLDEFSFLISDVKDELLIEASKSKLDHVRIFALKEIQTRGLFTESMALQMREDTSRKIRELCYRFLVEQGSFLDPSEVRKAFDDASSKNSLLDSLLVEPIDTDEIAFGFYRKLSLDQLIQRSDWYRLDGHLAYKAIALDHFSEHADLIRSHLNNRFTNFKEEADKSIRAKLGTFGDSIISSYEEKDLNSFIRSRFTAAALAGLVKNAEQDDISIARDYLSDPNDYVVLEAVRLIEQLGDASDVSALLALARAKYGELREASASAALKLSPGPEGAAKALLDTESSSLVAVVIEKMWSAPIEETANLLEPLLFHKNEDIRIKALTFIGTKQPAQKLKELLDRYLSKGTYYYNVVSWLDRVLHSPSSLKAVFSNQLEEKRR